MKSLNGTVPESAARTVNPGAFGVVDALKKTVMTSSTGTGLAMIGTALAVGIDVPIAYAAINSGLPLNESTAILASIISGPGACALAPINLVAWGLIALGVKEMKNAYMENLSQIRQQKS
ncbi:hypothetical protein COY90_01185 [Candidatus Roizmanbacteria bacterium CG_4_10_14_0_8_um_filter_39_9]|uniref:Uncharacterized protein n=1 Tax=Candidatus Roizmanbacteria bacterium CG_4_10_14_0_8_um_filter_39_9 TaxID=1974829 RepID=A0A2M7QDN2_9BACT|nr:MAG: hypothetical protein COY90_01185 [Candidatus Roizmanbacteria bacterium CG_4_10_14_0_8_um_filter_39_9]